MDLLWFLIIVFLFLFLIAAWPSWPYTRERWPYSRGGNWRYAPSGGAALFIVLVFVLFWLGLISVIWWPWAFAY